MENLCCVREHSVQFFVRFFYTVKLHRVYGALHLVNVIYTGVIVAADSGHLRFVAVYVQICSSYLRGAADK